VTRQRFPGRRPAGPAARLPVRPGVVRGGAAPADRTGVGSGRGGTHPAGRLAGRRRVDRSGRNRRHGPAPGRLRQLPCGRGDPGGPRLPRPGDRGPLDRARDRRRAACRTVARHDPGAGRARPRPAGPARITVHKRRSRPDRPRVGGARTPRPRPHQRRDRHRVVHQHQRRRACTSPTSCANSASEAGSRRPPTPSVSGRTTPRPVESFRRRGPRCGCVCCPCLWIRCR
jgi:hypothetical protein